MDGKRRKRSYSGWIPLLALLPLLPVHRPAEAGEEARVAVLEPVSCACEHCVLRCVNSTNRRAGVARLSSRFLARLAAGEAEARAAHERRAPKEGMAEEKGPSVPALFNLPWGETFDVLLEPKVGPCGGLVWLGRAATPEGAAVHVILTLYKGACGPLPLDPPGELVVATLTVGHRVIEILPRSEAGLCLIREPIYEVEPRALPRARREGAAERSAPPVRSGAEAGEASAEEPPPGEEEDPLADCPGTKLVPRIDLLVVYTQSAIAWDGLGETALRARIRDAVDRTNLALEDSRASACIRLVGCRKTAWSPAIVVEELYRLMSGYASPRGPRHLPAFLIHRWREQLGADVVALVTTRGVGGYYGLTPRLPACAGGECYAWTLDIGPFSQCAYAMVSVDGMQGRYTLAHEIGHILGCCHETCESPIAPFAHPYRLTVDEQDHCTIMGVEGNLPRLPYYSASDARVNHEGQPLGKEGEADNAAVIQRTAGLVSRYRDPPP